MQHVTKFAATTRTGTATTRWIASDIELSERLSRHITAQLNGEFGLTAVMGEFTLGTTYASGRTRAEACERLAAYLAAAAKNAPAAVEEVAQTETAITGAADLGDDDFFAALAAAQAGV